MRVALAPETQKQIRAAELAESQARADLAHAHALLAQLEADQAQAKADAAQADVERLKAQHTAHALGR